jgi:7,8-dihydro-6-hydroxymethylpterin-pyrophosphokinase
VRRRTIETAGALQYDTLRSVEARLGRRRTADAWAARTMDLDLLLSGD